MPDGHRAATNKVDTTLIGNDYLSFLFSFTLMKQKERILLLNDNHSPHEDLATDTLCQLEKDFLKFWGEDQNIPPLRHIDRYVVQRPLTMAIDDCQIRFGHTPSQNYLECLRKFPSFFKRRGMLYFAPVARKKDKDKFDRDFFAYCKRLARKIYCFHDISTLDKKLFSSLCPDELLEIVDIFSLPLQKGAELEKSERWIFNTLVYMARGHFHKRLSITGGPIEIFHLILSLLSPHYELNQRELLTDMKAFYLDRGGQYLQTQVQEWHFDRGHPWRLELSSYKGVIWPQRISFLGNIPSEAPMDLGRPIKNYTCVNVRWMLNKTFTTGWEQEKALFTRVDKIGTDGPLWEAHFFPGEIRVKIFVFNEWGHKISFIQEEIHRIVLERLSPFIPRLKSNIIHEELSFGPEILTEPGKRSFYHLHRKDKDITVRYTSPSGKKIKLKNVNYFGPFKEGSLGLFSTLIELKQDGRILPIMPHS